MQRQRGELVPIGEVVADLDGPVKTLSDASPQARHHFTQADQVNQLVSASEADPDLGFMARMLALCSLPRTNPGNRHQYKRANGPYKLVMVAGADNKLPYGGEDTKRNLKHAKRLRRSYVPGCGAAEIDLDRGSAMFPSGNRR